MKIDEQWFCAQSLATSINGCVSNVGRAFPNKSLIDISNYDVFWITLVRVNTKQRIEKKFAIYNYVYLFVMVTKIAISRFVVLLNVFECVFFGCARQIPTWPQSYTVLDVVLYYCHFIRYVNILSFEFWWSAKWLF